MTKATVTASVDIKDIRGMLKRPRKRSVSVKQMNAAVRHAHQPVKRMPGRLRGLIRIGRDFDAPLGV